MTKPVDAFSFKGTKLSGDTRSAIADTAEGLVLPTVSPLPLLGHGNLARGLICK